MKYKRILLKLSGEALGGAAGSGISTEAIQNAADEILAAHKLGVQVAVVVGGGNIFRGLSGSQQGIDRTSGDYMGMLATVINALALQNTLEKSGIPTRVQTGIEMNRVAEPFILRKAVRHLEKGRIVIFGGGTGNPFFSSELSVDALLKATKVNGVYDSDPKKNPDAQRFSLLSYEDAIKLHLGVMDASAFSLCSENKIPIIVFDAFVPGNLTRVLNGDTQVGTVVSSEPSVKG